MYHRIIFSLITLLYVPFVASAQYTFFNPAGSFAVESSLENTDELRMPIYRNAMTSLTVSGDFVLGGTSAQKGLTPLLFTSSLSQRKITAIKQLDDVIKNANELKAKIGTNEKNLPGWIQDHISQAQNFIDQANTGYHELKGGESDG
jgi:hypothetical protein